jgi:hypothetical protein
MEKRYVVFLKVLLNADNNLISLPIELVLLAGLIKLLGAFGNSL